MDAGRVRAAGAALLALAATRAAAAGYGSYGYGGPGVMADGWPSELALRPPTLARGMAELDLPVQVDVSPGAGEQPVNVPLGLHLGATDWLTVGIAHARGFCVSGGCATGYDDVRADALVRFFEAGPLTGTYGVALAAAPLQGRATLSGEARAGLRLASRWYALDLSAVYGFGLSNREADRIQPVRFPLAGTLGFGTFETVPNRETVSLPLTAILQAGPHAALAYGVAVNGVLDPATGSFSDSYRVPVGLAAIVSPTAAVDLGAGLTFPNLWGRSTSAAPRSDARVLEAFVAIRPGAAARRAAPVPAAPAIAPRAATPGAPETATAIATSTAQAAPAATPAEAYTIAIDGFAFRPASLEVPPGATITVRNHDAAPHTVTSERAPDVFAPGGAANVSFDTGAFVGGERTISIPPDAPPGTVVPYYCAVHKGSMRTPNGEIRIVAPR